MARRKSPYEKLEAEATRGANKRLAEVRAREAEDRAARREYAAAAQKHWLQTFASTTTSADTELRTSFQRLRGRARVLGRDSPYAKRTKSIIRNNVVFTGIGMQGNVKGVRGAPRRPLNKSIGDAFSEWWMDPESCHTGGELCGPDFEQQLIDQVVEAGEVFVRFRYEPMGRSEIPLALELIESERCPHDLTPASGITRPAIRLGVEHDPDTHRPRRFWFRTQHPSETQWSFDAASERLFPVLAQDVIHLRVIQRWPQRRGVPWIHAVADTLHNMRGYTESEIVAARGAANYFASLEYSDWDINSLRRKKGSDVDEQGDRFMTIEPGTVATPPAGAKLSFHSPNRPNDALDPFMRYMLREVAAGLDVSYESLSRDYSKSNYSSSRLSLLDDRDVWRVIQMWFIRNFRMRLHRVFMQQAVMAGAIRGLSLEEFASDPTRYEQAKWKPRGWTWVDPQKEVKAFKEAIKGGLTSRTRVIASTAGGADIEDIDEERVEELRNSKQMQLSFDTDPGAEPASPEQEREDEDEQQRRDDEDEREETRRLRVL